MSEKIFIGNTSEKTFSNGGSIIKIGLPLDAINKHIKNGWLNITVQKKKDPKGDGKDWFTCVDTYEPKPRTETHEEEQINIQEIPF